MSLPGLDLPTLSFAAPLDGETNADTLTVDLDHLITSRLLIQGSSGAGKGWAIRTLLEQTHGRVQQLVLDKEGEFSTLRERYDYILAGADGDVPATPKTARVLCRHLMELGASAVIDLYDLTNLDRRAFVRDFLTELMALPKEFWRPLLVVIDEAHFFCLDEETELLTANGWRKWDQVTVGDQCVTYDMETGAYAHGPVQRMLVRQYDGPMVRLLSDGIDCLATPDHRVVLHRIQRGVGRYQVYDPTFCPAEKVPNHVYIPKGGSPFGKGIAGLSEDMCRLLGWIITDGHFTGGNEKKYLGIEQSRATVKHGQSMVAVLDELTCRLGAVGRYIRPPRPMTRPDGKGLGGGIAESVQYYLGRELSCEALKWLGDDIHRIPREILNEASEKQISALFRGLVEGDGSSRKGIWMAFHPGMNTQLADDFQEIALKLGYSAVKTWVPQIGQWRIALSQRRWHYIRRPVQENYAGLVWDITVSTGAFVARRRGKVFVTGNCPEGAPSEAAAAVISLCSEGRKRGYSAALATQRLSKLSKDAAADLHNKMIGLTGLDVDVRRAADELGFGKDQATSLKKLKAGQFYVYGPAFSPEVTLVRTGEIQTTHPKAGQIASYTPPPPAEAVRALLEQLQGLAQEAEAEATAEREKADRTAALERQVESLQKQLSDAGDSAQEAPERVVEKVVEKIVTVEKWVEVPALEPGQVEQLRDIADTLMAGSKDMALLAQEILVRVARVKILAPASVEETNGLPPAPPEESKSVPKIANQKTGMAAEAPPSNGSGQTVPRPQQAILNALADFAALGVSQPRREHVAISIKVSPTSSGYRNNLSALRTAGLIEYPQNGLVSLTITGREDAHTSDRSPTLATLREAWYQWLPGPQAQIMKVLVGLGQRAISRGALAAQVGASSDSSGYRNNLSALRSLGLLDYPASGQVAATKLLFPEGLPE